jgi:hypothetical protein
MKHSAYCEWCGYETALVEDEEDVDWDLLDIHQEFCKGVEEAKKKGTQLVPTMQGLKRFIDERV